VSSGSTLLGFSGGPEAVDAAIKGAPVRIILTMTSEFASNIITSAKLASAKGVTQQSPLADRIKALKGAKIGITSAGSSTDQLIRFLLQKQGMNPDKDVEIQALKTGPPMLAALKQGTIDAVVLSPPTGEQAVAGGYGVVLVNPMAGQVPELKGMIFHLGSANLKDIQSRPQLLTSAVKAIARAQRLMKTDKAKAKELLRPHFKALDPKVFDLAYEDTAGAFPANPIPTKDSVEVALKFGAQFGQPVSVAYDKIVDPSIAQAAVKALGS
ncbi:MAG: ABC transporter substrate-binding protein, partial [Chloroflexota bacterium]|nr:ABC transporter substrate-binding protein [Chloroflexota bacterium]